MNQVRKEFLWALGVIALLLVIMLYATAAEAHGYNNDDITVNVNTGESVTQVVENYSISDSTVAELVAKAAACDHSFYWGKPGKWQLSPQGAYYDGELELCIGAAYRPVDTDVMFNLSIVPDEDTDQILIQGGALFVLD